MSELTIIERWRLRRRPWSVRLYGMASETWSPPLEFIRFRTEREVLAWIEGAEDRDLARTGTAASLAVWQPVDLRVVDR